MDNTNNSSDKPAVTPPVAPTGGDTPSAGPGSSLSGGGNPAGGGNVPGGTGNSQIDMAVKDVANALTSVKPILLPALTPTERKHLPKVRKSAQALVDELVSLALAKPSLLPLGTDPKGLSDQLDLVGQFNTLQLGVNNLHTGVADTLTRIETDLYKTALDVYAIASRAGVVDPAVAAVVAKMAKTLAHGPRTKHKMVKVPVKTVTMPTDAPVEPIPSLSDLKHGSGSPPSASGSPSASAPSGNGQPAAAPATGGTGGGSGGGTSGPVTGSK